MGSDKAMDEFKINSNIEREKNERETKASQHYKKRGL